MSDWREVRDVIGALRGPCHCEGSGVRNWRELAGGPVEKSLRDGTPCSCAAGAKFLQQITQFHNFTIQEGR